MLADGTISDYNLVWCVPGFSSGASSSTEASVIVKESVECVLIPSGARCLRSVGVQGSRPWALWEGTTAVLFAVSVCQGGFLMGGEVPISGMNAGLSTPAAVIRVIMILKWDTVGTTIK